MASCVRHVSRYDVDNAKEHCKVSCQNVHTVDKAFLAHLSQGSQSELIVYQWSVVRPSSSGDFAKSTLNSFTRVEKVLPFKGTGCRSAHL